MDNKRTGIFDQFDNVSTDKAEEPQKFQKEELIDNFEQSVSTDFYHKRSFIKDGELTAEPEVLFIPADLPAVSTPVETKIGSITLYNDLTSQCAGIGSDRGIYRVTAEGASVEEMEQHLLQALSDNAKRFFPQNVSIYAFAPFKDEAVKDVVTGEYYEFKGRFELIKGTHGWVLLSYNKVVRLPE